MTKITKYSIYKLINFKKEEFYLKKIIFANKWEFLYGLP